MKRLILLPLILLSTIAKADAPYEPLPLQEHYSILISSLQKEKWNLVVNKGKFITEVFPFSPFTNEAHYFLGVAYYKKADFELANRHFTRYMRSDSTPKHFDEAVRYKFEIAKLFELKKAKKHLMGLKRLPKWIPDRELAIEIFEEVIAAMPRSEMAAEALFRKGNLLAIFDEYNESIESYQTVIRRFPKNPYAPDCYVGIAKVYMDECLSEFPDPDRLNLAELNLERFRQDFPTEPRLDDVENMIVKMRERFAKQLYEIGDYYKRTKKWGAAKVYFDSLLRRYPSTSFAFKAEKHLITVENKLAKQKK